MTLRPAFEATLRHGDHAVTLRASLRAATLIAQQDGGFPAVLSGITSLAFGPVRAVIPAAATSQHDAAMILASVAAAPLRPFLEDAAPVLVELIAAILPDTDTPAEAEKTRTSKPDTTGRGWPDHFADLYRYGTGWLGWTPEAVWNASPLEIEAAFKAHVDRVIAMNGGSTDEEPEALDAAAYDALMADPDSLDPTFDRSALHALKARF